MTNTNNNSATQTPKSTKWKKIARGAIAGIAIVISGGVGAYQAVVLPGCDETRVTDTVHAIFEENGTALSVLDRIETVSSKDDAYQCAAYIESGEEKADITYTVSWNGWEQEVRIGEVETF